MESGDNSGGGNNGGGHGHGTNPGGGPSNNWQPATYKNLSKETGEPYYSSYPDPASVLQTYNPADNTPPVNDKQLGSLMDYRFETQVRGLGYNRWDVKHTFPSNSLTDKTARARLLSHILTHSADIPSAYHQIDISSDIPRWDKVKITSFLINSLNRSNY
jgi:hypothetical protein